MQKLNYIDSLRGIAILLVVMLHTSQVGANNYPDYIQFFFDFGSKGVQLFFVCSAFTIFLSYDLNGNTKKRGVFNFYIRRFFRIAPLYYLGIIYYLFQDGWGDRYWLGDHNSITIENLLGNFSFIHSINPYWMNSIVPGGWSISIEMLFYLFVPLLFRYINSLSRAINSILVILPFVFILTGYLSRNVMITDNTLWSVYLYLYFPNQLFMFLLGILFFHFYKSGEFNLKGYQWYLIIGILFYTIVYNREVYFGNFILTGILFLVLMIGVSKFPLLPVIDKFTSYIGKLSYSIYIVHFAILHFMTKFSLVNLIQYNLSNFILRFIICLTLTIIISNFTNKYIEDYFRKLGGRLIQYFNQK